MCEGGKKQLEENISKSISNLFELKKKMKQLKLLEIEILEKKNYFIPIRVGSFWNNNCIEYESNGDKNKSLSVKDYLDEIKPFLRDIIIITLAIDFFKILMKRVYCIQRATI